MSQPVSLLTQMPPRTTHGLPLAPPDQDSQPVAGNARPLARIELPLLGSTPLSAKLLREDTRLRTTRSGQHRGVPGLPAEVPLQASGETAVAALLALALTGRFRSGGWGTRPGAPGAQLPGELGGCCHCSKGRWGGDGGAEGLGSTTSCGGPVHAVRRFTGG